MIFKGSFNLFCSLIFSKSKFKKTYVDYIYQCLYYDLKYEQTESLLTSQFRILIEQGPN